MNWPAQSTDLNPLENLWGIIKAQIIKDKPKKLGDSKNEIISSWNNISKDFCLKLIKFMPKRLKNVIKQKGTLLIIDFVY